MRANIDIIKFLDQNSACQSARDWAEEQGHKTLGDVWKDETLKPKDRVWIATRPGEVDDMTLRRFSLYAARQVQHLMTDPRSIAALETVERYIQGEATQKDLAAVGDAAWAAALAAAGYANWAAAWAAALAASGDVAWAAAEAASGDVALDAAWSAAWSAAWAASGAAAWAASGAAALDAQATWLLANVILD